MFACDKAIDLAPGNGWIIDSRGLARAMTGDIEGAIEDFKAFIAWDSDQEYESEKAQRQTWIEALEQGENPFTPELLEVLRSE